jgi:hypothetical protein
MVTQGIGPAVYEVPTALCSDHARARDRAAALIDEHPAVGRQHGQVAIDRLSAALIGLEIEGWLRPLGFGLTSTDDGLRELIRTMAPIGGQAAWTASGLVGPSKSRWSHVPEELRKEARMAHHDLIRRRTEPTRPFGPPADGASACLYCGVGSIHTTASNAAREWGSIVRVGTSGLTAGEARPGVATGYLCRVCRRSTEGRGLGLSSIERAVLAHLDHEIRNGYHLTIPGLHAWAARRNGSTPNATPWAHLNLAAIEAALPELRDSGLVRRIGEEWPGGGIVGYVRPSEVRR